MKISVIVPVYNTEKFISRALDSILSQDYKDFEVICIDDGSKDNSAQIIKEKAKRNTCIKYYKQDNHGPGVARKNGLIKASGELIYFLDSDDYLTDKLAFSKIVDIYNNYNPDVIFFNIKVLNPEAEYIIKPFDSKIIKSGYNSINELFGLHINANLYSKIMKRELIDEKMFIDSNTFEDFYTSYLYLDKCKNYYYLDDVLYCCYHGEDNNTHLTSADSLEKKKRRFNIVNLTYSKLNNDISKRGISSYCEQIIIGEIKNRFKSFFNIESYKNNRKVKKEIKGIVRIVLDNNYYVPNGKFKSLKKIIFNTFLFIHK